MIYVAYYRVSTQKQGRSGLGLEAQQHAVKSFLKPDDQLIAEYREIESGKNDDRPQLAAAIRHSQREGATLVIAKLDRLGRHAAFVMALRDSGCKFTCLDVPDANTLTIGILSTIAQHEREIISERIRAALAAKKRRGQKLGNPANLTSEGRAKGPLTRSRQVRQRHEKQIEVVRLYREVGLSFGEIARRMSDAGYTSPTGKTFRSETARRFFSYSQKKPEK